MRLTFEFYKDWMGQKRLEYQRGPNVAGFALA